MFTIEELKKLEQEYIQKFNGEEPPTLYEGGGDLNEVVEKTQRCIKEGVPYRHSEYEF